MSSSTKLKDILLEPLYRAMRHLCLGWISFVRTPSSILALTYPLRRSDTCGAIGESSKRWNDGFRLGSGVMNENVKKCVFLKTRFLAVGNLIGANSFEPHCI
jgi:hypothetical protein